MCLVAYFSARPWDQNVQRISMESRTDQHSENPFDPIGDELEAANSATVVQDTIRYLEQNSLIFPGSDLGRAAIIAEIKQDLVMRILEVKQTAYGFQTDEELYMRQPKQRCPGVSISIKGGKPITGRASIVPFFLGENLAIVRPVSFRIPGS